MLAILFEHWRDCPDALFHPFPNFSLQGDRPWSPDDGSFLFNEDLLTRAQQFRTSTNEPSIINSWYRSPLYNAHTPGSVPLSTHTQGRAIDVSTRGRNHVRYLKMALQIFSGIGLYHSNQGEFIHLDTGRPRLWYGDAESKAFWQPLVRS